MGGREFEVLTRDVTPSEARFLVRIPAELKYLEGHFPSDPLVPGLGQLMMVEDRIREAWPETGPVQSVTRVKFQSALRPLDELTVLAQRTGPKVKFEIRKGETVCTIGTFTFASP